jgi:hypothetical protein
VSGRDLAIRIAAALVVVALIMYVGSHMVVLV